MCGRYSLAKDLSELTKLVDFICRIPLYAPRYNIAPRQQAPVLLIEKTQPVMKLMRWGLIPSWVKDEAIGDKMINARAETINERTSYRKPFNSQRCLIPADGFYEWQRRGKSITPFRFTLRDKSAFCFAGIYERWIKSAVGGELDFIGADEPPPSQVIETFSIITTEANAMVAPVHERMPVILHDEDYQRWIDCGCYGSRDVKYLLRPFSTEAMDSYRVSSLVNSAKNDSPECLLPV